MRDSILFFYVATMSRIDSELFGRLHLLRVVAVVSPCVPCACNGLSQWALVGTSAPRINGRDGCVRHQLHYLLKVENGLFWGGIFYGELQVSGHGKRGKLPKDELVEKVWTGTSI